MTNRELVYKAVEIFEHHLRDNISVGSVAKQIGFSKYYFCRLFKELTTYSPHMYYSQRKLSLAANQVVKSEDKIIDIALSYGFNSPEVFARAFTKQFGLTPSEARRQGYVPAENRVDPIKKSFINKFDHVVTKQPELVTLDELKLVGIQFYYDLSQKNDLSEPWQMLMDNLNEIKHLSQPCKYFQVQYWLDNQTTNGIFFYAAVQVDRVEDLPLALTAKIIPSQDYFKFKHKGRSNEVHYTYDYIYGTWLPDTSFQLDSAFNFELYGDEYLGPYNDESISEIYIPMKKK